MQAADDLIAAPATPPGAGGIGIIRLSGVGLAAVARNILHIGKLPPPRLAVRARFLAADGAVLDDGLCLYFPAPHSFTGQDILELHGHGGDAVLRSVLERCLELGARLANAGEFTLRAYLNDKLDLAQAEALADLILAGDAIAARAAARSLSGEFSATARQWSTQLESLRSDLETRLDFSDEDITAHDTDSLTQRLSSLVTGLQKFRAGCERGARLATGMTAVLVGRPNVGKSSLMNQLCGDAAAIVDADAGTTRDLVVRTITIAGMSVQLTDTAGLRDGKSAVERAGMSLAVTAAQTADIIIVVRDGQESDNKSDNESDNKHDAATYLSAIAATQKTESSQATMLRVRNKIDADGLSAGCYDDEIYLSAKTGDGVEDLRTAIADIAGLNTADVAPAYTARARHVAALDECLRCLAQAQASASQLEICAAWLKSARDAVESLTGVFDDEQLLGEIFSRFCIGK